MNWKCFYDFFFSQGLAPALHKLELHAIQLRERRPWVLLT